MTIETVERPEAILSFWFAEENKSAWFNSTEETDQAIRTAFEATYISARDGKLQHWLETAQGCLALVILFDQFPLNMYRGKTESFATEQKARDVAEHAIGKGFDQTLSAEEKSFLYMPYMHSESLADQDKSIELFTAADLSNNIRFAHHHRDIVARYGRFPHRNEILGRINTPEEEEYLASPEAFQG